MTSSSSPSPQATMHEIPYDNQNYNELTVFFGMAIFSAVVALFFVLLILYIHRRCCVHHDPINLLHSPQPPLTLSLDPAEIRSLPVVLFRRETTAEEKEEKECCICLGGFEEGEKMKILPRCLHCYHCQCVDRWLKTESSCPLCRVSIRVDSFPVSLPTQVD